MNLFGNFSDFGEFPNFWWNSEKQYKDKYETIEDFNDELYDTLRRFRVDKENLKNSIRDILNENEKKDTFFEEDLEAFFCNLQDRVVLQACPDNFEDVMCEKYFNFNIGTFSTANFNICDALKGQDLENYEMLMDVVAIFIEKEKHRKKLKSFKELDACVKAVLRLVENLTKIGVSANKIQFNM